MYVHLWHSVDADLEPINKCGRIRQLLRNLIKVIFPLNNHALICGGPSFKPLTFSTGMVANNSATIAAPFFSQS